MLSPLFFGYRDYDTLFGDLKQGLVVHSQFPNLNIRLESKEEGHFVVIATARKHGIEHQTATTKSYPMNLFDVRDGLLDGLRNAEKLGMLDHIKVAFESGTVVHSNGRTKFRLEEALEVLEHTESTDASREAIYMVPTASISRSHSMNF